MCYFGLTILSPQADLIGKMREDVRKVFEEAVFPIVEYAPTINSEDASDVVVLVVPSHNAATWAVRSPRHSRRPSTLL
jgi:hypothetical protein